MGMGWLLMNKNQPTRVAALTINDACLDLLAEITETMQREFARRGFETKGKVDMSRALETAIRYFHNSMPVSSVCSGDEKPYAELEDDVGKKMMSLASQRGINPEALISSLISEAYDASNQVN